VVDAMRRPGVNLVLGYNTALFSALLRLRGRAILMNMDGVEWKRAKWSLPVRAWFYANEFIGVNVASVPIADHPEIARHLRRHTWRRIEMVPYGSDEVKDWPAGPVRALGLSPRGYVVSIARIEPENSILEIVRAFSARPRNFKLVVLGNMAGGNPYHGKVRAAASPDVVFPGAIYEPAVVIALRAHALAYVHGHQVGGTNPSLVEALGVGSAVIAHDNRFNRWVAGPAQFYFADAAALMALMDALDGGRLDLDTARGAARERHLESFTVDAVSHQYEALLERFA
ncbi:MAG: DUF1972 domain-containing protein, partial [Hyphomicrobiales bacterium]